MESSMPSKGGSVVTWGNIYAGGYGSDPDQGANDGPDVGDLTKSQWVAQELSSGVKEVFSTDFAFAALKTDGSVITWGGEVALDGTTERYTYRDAGGKSYQVADQLTGDVSTIYSNAGAFAALKYDLVHIDDSITTDKYQKPLKVDQLVLEDSLYQIVEGPTWEEAEANALKVGGNLVSINSEYENQWLIDTFKDADSSPWIEAYPEIENHPAVDIYWTGLKNNGETWLWSDGSEANYYNWGIKEPTNDGDKVHLILEADPNASNIWSGVAGKWNDTKGDGDGGR